MIKAAPLNSTLNIYGVGNNARQNSWEIAVGKVLIFFLATRWSICSFLVDHPTKEAIKE